MKVFRKGAAMVLAFAVAMIILLLGQTKNTFKELSAKDIEEKKFAPLISRSDPLTMGNAYNTYNSPQDDWKKRKKKQQHVVDETEMHYHDNAIFIIMYHKTGYVLTRQLKKAVTMVEIESNRPHEKDRYKTSGQTFYGTDRETGERFAFDTVGGWVRSAFAQRRHSVRTHCPIGYQLDPFKLKSGQLYLQESPDLFCNVKKLKKAISARKVKIIHFVRNPFDMVLSNYLYHSQEPTPEKWVHSDDPCHVKYEDGDTLASNVLPSIGTDKIDENYFSNITKMCRSLFQSKPSLQDSTFYEHLLELDDGDGLRLATAQMVAASGNANRHMAGGDVSRMANNIVKLKELQSYMPSEVEVLTMSTEEFIEDATKSTMKFFDFVFGANNTSLSRSLMWEKAQSQQNTFDRMSGALKRRKKNKHVTQSSTEEEKERKKRLKELLHNDKDLAPILKLTESLVDEALRESAIAV